MRQIMPGPIALLVILSRLTVGCVHQTAPKENSRAVCADARVAPGDLLLIVTDLDVPNHTSDEFILRVDENGEISLPWIGAVWIAGREVSDLRRFIAQSYRDEGVEGSIDPEVWRIETADRASVKLGRIAPGDDLLINLWGVESPNGKTTNFRHVDDDGQVNVTEVGSVRVVGLTETQAMRAIHDAARERSVTQDLKLTVRRIPQWAVSSQNAR
jgi:protein involved in polysaccharide export with SLBB domain